MKHLFLAVLAFLFLAFAQEASATHEGENTDAATVQVGLKPSAYRNPLGKTASRSWGFGIRGGDPAGLTLKKYMGKNAWEFNLGRSHTWGWGRYDKEYKDMYDDDWEYSGRFPIAFQVHYLFQRDIRGISGLEWYAGLGGQIRYNSYKVRYWTGGKRGVYYEERFTDLDLGADFILGLEYTFKEIPISVALDANVFMEVYDSPFWFWSQGGLAVRYNF